MPRYLLRKALNELVNKAEFMIRRERLISYPPIVFIEPTNRCSLHCPLCPTGRGDPRYPRGSMDLAGFSRLMEAVGPWARTVHLYNWGEPLLHGDIWKMVRIARAYGPRVWLGTTLNQLSGNGVAEMVASGLDKLNVSIDGTGQEAYGKYRRGGSFDRVMKNLKAVIAEKRKQRSRNPVIRWQYLVMKHNEGGIARARAMARELGIGFDAKAVRLDMADFRRPSAASLRGEGEWLPTEPQYNRYEGRRKADYPHGHPCRYLWDRAAISWDGNIAPCCRVYGKTDYFGSALAAGFRRVWNGAEYRHARRLFRNGTRAGGTVCDTCVAGGS